MSQLHKHDVDNMYSFYFGGYLYMMLTPVVITYCERRYFQVYQFWRIS